MYLPYDRIGYRLSFPVLVTVILARMNYCCVLYLASKLCTRRLMPNIFSEKYCEVLYCANLYNIFACNYFAHPILFSQIK